MIELIDVSAHNRSLTLRLTRKRGRDRWMLAVTCSRSLHRLRSGLAPCSLLRLLPPHQLCHRSARSTLAAERLKRGYTCTTATTATKPRKMAVQQPEWTLPVSKTEEPVLKVYNSLTRTKVRFSSLLLLLLLLSLLSLRLFSLHYPRTLR